MMTTRITSRQIEQFAKLVRDSLTAAKEAMSKDGAQNILGRPKEFMKRFIALVTAMAGEYYTLLSDEEAVAWIVKYAKKPEVEARQIVNGWRQKARAAGVADEVSIHAEDRPGCLFKRDMPQMGPCWKNFQYLQDWNFPDPLTEHCLASWVPVPLAGSADNDASHQAALVASFKIEAGFPAWYGVSFGSVNHVAGLSLAHFKATGKDPFNGLVVRTDTCRAGGYRLDLDWDEASLSCGGWGWGEYANSRLAVFALGVVLGR